MNGDSPPLRPAPRGEFAGPGRGSEGPGVSQDRQIAADLCNDGLVNVDDGEFRFAAEGHQGSAQGGDDGAVADAGGSLARGGMADACRHAVSAGHDEGGAAQPGGQGREDQLASRALPGPPTSPKAEAKEEKPAAAAAPKVEVASDPEIPEGTEFVTQTVRDA